MKLNTIYLTLKNESKYNLLYVREQHETIYTALMLRIPTLYGLLQAVSSDRTSVYSKQFSQFITYGLRTACMLFIFH
jgi:hypothetical protein